MKLKGKSYNSPLSQLARMRNYGQVNVVRALRSHLRNLRQAGLLRGIPAGNCDMFLASLAKTIDENWCRLKRQYRGKEMR